MSDSAVTIAARAWAVFLIIVLGCALRMAFSHEEQAQETVSLTERLGGAISPGARFRDESGAELSLGEAFRKPSLLLPVYYSCPRSCGVQLANLAAALAAVPQRPGEEYQIFSLSIDEADTPASALRAKSNYLAGSSRELQAGWRFLTGDRENIKKAADSLGFQFKRTGERDFAHPNVLVALAPGGTIIRYLHGPAFLPFDIGMALTEASRGTPELSVRKLVSYCYGYDSEKKTYTFRAVRILSAGILAAIGILMVVLLRKR